MAYLYRHIRLDKNEPFYVGIGSDTTYYRSKRETKRNKIWNDIRKKCEIRSEIVLDDLTWEEACIKEIEFVRLYGRIDRKTGCLANLTDGGDGYLNPSDEVRSKLVASKKGSNNPMFGKTFSEEHRKHHSQALKGRIVSQETREKISEAQKGKPRNSEAMKKHLSKINSGSNHPQFGKHRSEETKRKISLAHITRNLNKNI